MKKDLRNLADTVNTYYGFGLIIYGLFLFIGKHNHLFLLSFLLLTPILGGWTGYLLREYFERRNQRHGFLILEDSMIYDVSNSYKTKLFIKTLLRAATDHLMVYPIGYRWTGSGIESVPKLLNQGQQLLGPIDTDLKLTKDVYPYKLTESTDGQWHYWFVAINPAVHRGEKVEIKYSQAFNDTKKNAKPCLGYFVRIPMKKLTLTVKFSKNNAPKKLTSCYIKSNDSSKPTKVKGVEFDPYKFIAKWTINNPKKGYCYRIDWK